MNKAEILAEMNDLEAYRLITAEVRRARKLHPEWPTDQVHAAATVAEEAGELIQAALDHRYKDAEICNADVEAVHTAATAIRFLTRR